MVDDLAKACGTEKYWLCLVRILTLCQIYIHVKQNEKHPWFKKCFIRNEMQCPDLHKHSDLQPQPPWGLGVVQVPKNSLAWKCLQYPDLYSKTVYGTPNP